MTDALALLHTPTGVPGSGRVRYGAAMALWRDGRISEEVLEVYRVASAHDGLDPLPVLAARRLPLPPRLARSTPLRALYDAGREYLLSLKHPGAPDVARGLPQDPGAEAPARAPRRQTVVDRWLPVALAALNSERPALAGAIAAAAPLLDWVTYDAYPPDRIGADFARGHAFAALRGDGAPFADAAQDFELGLFLIAPDVLYRDHRHPAPELYAPLTGPHGWRFGPGRPLRLRPAHDPVWNPPLRPHLTKVGPIPFLAFYVWTAAVDRPAEVLEAPDWPALEALRLG